MQDVPTRMELGSRGPAVKVYLEKLQEWALFHTKGAPTGLVPDEDFLEKGAGWTKTYQSERSLAVDGGLGTETRPVFEAEMNWNFEAAARAAGGVTVFVQPNDADGNEVPPITWDAAA